MTISPEHWADAPEPELDPGVEYAFLLEEVDKFKSEHQNVGQANQRAQLAVGLVDDLRYVFGSSAENISLPTRLQLDVIEMWAWRVQLNVAEAMPYADWDDGQVEYAGQRAYAARDAVHDHISQYSLVSGFDPTAYEQLLNSFNLARILIKNPLDPLVSAKNHDAIDLGQMLAAHRLIDGLRNLGFLATRLEQSHERRRRTHVIIPGNINDPQPLHIRIQPGAGGRLRIEPYGGNILVDMNIMQGGSEAFAISPTDMSILSSAFAKIVNVMPPLPSQFQLEKTAA